ncbi:MAG TPA: SDR family oxidoreductase [Polyangia bacterium]|jgi:hypothetical protein
MAPGEAAQTGRRWALVTGASSGLGRELARQLAARGYDLVLTARREERLVALAAELTARHADRAVEVVALDLGAPGAAAALAARTEGAGRPIEVLVNNAGFATYGPFVEQPWEKTAQELDLNVRALTELCARFVPAMRARGRGFVLNVASFVAALPLPSYATYAAGKAYVRNFSEALGFELRGTGVSVCALCPGGITTEFWDVAGHRPRPIVRATADRPAKVARVGLTALFAGRRLVTAGLLNKLWGFLLRFFPRWGMTRVGATLSKPYAAAR